jgi:hypothetical protein
MTHWNLVFALLLGWTATVTPYEVGFLTIRLNWLFVVNRIIDSCFLFHIYIMFQLPYQVRDGLLTYPGYPLHPYI